MGYFQDSFHYCLELKNLAFKTKLHLLLKFNTETTLIQLRGQATLEVAEMSISISSVVREITFPGILFIWEEEGNFSLICFTLLPCVSLQTWKASYNYAIECQLPCQYLGFKTRKLLTCVSDYCLWFITGGNTAW